MIEFILVFILPIFLLLAFVVIWKSNRRLHLVKDCRSGKEQFYWESLEGRVLSPVYANLSEAKYWWVAHEFSTYTGPERRQRVDDRRKDSESRRLVDAKFNVVGLDQNGRRLTDIEATPDIER